MGIRQSAARLHWNYFLALDADLQRLARFVEFQKDNFRAYSIEMARLLLAAASEVDVVAKLLCQRAKSKSRAGSINAYRKELNQAFPKIADMQVTIPRYGLQLIPWSNWKNDKTPDWWSDYNLVKHKRNAHFRKANLKNTLNSIGALFVLLLHYYQEDARSGKLGPEPVVFRVAAGFIKGHKHNGTMSLPLYDV